MMAGMTTATIPGGLDEPPLTPPDPNAVPATRQLRDVAVKATSGGRGVLLISGHDVSDQVAACAIHVEAGNVSTVDVRLCPQDGVEFTGPALVTLLDAADVVPTGAQTAAAVRAYLSAVDPASLEAQTMLAFAGAPMTASPVATALRVLIDNADRWLVPDGEVHGD